MPDDPRALRRRWETESGAEIVSAIMMRIAAGALDRSELMRILLPLADRKAVPSGMDMRGFSADIQFRDTDMAGLDMSHAMLGPSYFRCSLTGAVLEYSVLESIVGCEASGVRARKLASRALMNSNFADGDFSNARLKGATVSGCDLRRSLLVGANLKRSSFKDVDLRGADLRNAELDGSALVNVIVDGETDLRGTSLKGAFYEPRLGADGRILVPGSDLSAARTDETTMWAGNVGAGRDLAAALLAEARHRKGAQGLVDRLTTFLRNETAELDDSGEWTERFRRQLSDDEKSLLNALIDPAMRRLL